MENRGLEPLTLGLQSRCSEPTELIPRVPYVRQGEGKKDRSGTDFIPLSRVHRASLRSYKLNPPQASLLLERR